MKARVEAERLPRGGDRRTHLKLGLGGQTDVEWTVQVMQAQHAAAEPRLRTTSTMAGLDAAEVAGHVSPSDARSLRAGWTLAASMRNASVLWRGRPVESVPPTCATETASDGSSDARRVHRRPWRRTTSGWPAAAGPPPTGASTGLARTEPEAVASPGCRG